MEGEVAMLGIQLDHAVAPEGTADDVRGEGIEHPALDHPLDGARTELRVVPLVGYLLHGGIGVGQRDAIGGKGLDHPIELQAYHLRDLLLREGTEDGDLIDTIEELGADPLLEHLHHLRPHLADDLVGIRHRHTLEALPDQVTTHIGGHDDDRILEVRRPPLIVRQATVIQHLE